MSKKDAVIKSMLSMMDMGVVKGINSEWYNEAKEALLTDDYKAGLEAASAYLDNINQQHLAYAVLEL